MYAIFVFSSSFNLFAKVKFRSWKLSNKCATYPVFYTASRLIPGKVRGRLRNLYSISFLGLVKVFARPAAMLILFGKRMLAIVRFRLRTTRRGAILGVPDAPHRWGCYSQKLAAEYKLAGQVWPVRFRQPFIY